mmetsp:Transcript_13994/g.16216  ORF Transcript_13994/g.16216 Transcript_13994/m.16216 type:complete len:98 (+) Transcript_13994:115-408(+)
MYPSDVSRAVALIEGSVGIGLACGPGFGSLMYYFFGFKGPFYGLGMIYFVFALFIKPMISDEVETNPNNTFYVSRTNVYESADFSSPITYTNLIRNK